MEDEHTREQHLQQTEERFRLLIESAIDYAIFTLDINGNIDSWNSGAERVLGYREEEILGHSGDLIFTAEDRAAAVPAMEKGQAEREGRAEDERWHVRKDGSRFWASGVMTPLRDAGGGLRGYAKIMRDLTQQKLAQEHLRISEERYRLILENVKDYAIFTLDRDGIITSWNEGARRIKGYAAPEILGKHVSVFYPAEYLEAGKLQYEMENAEREGHSEDESWRIRKDGTRFWGDEIMTPLRDQNGQLQGFVKITRDLTLRKQAEEERSAVERYNSILAERNRMGQELHDTLAQGFTGIRFQLEAAEQRVREAPEEAEVHIARARDIAVQSLADARRTIRALRPQILDEVSLRVGLERLTEQARLSTAASVSFVGQGEEYPLTPGVESDLFRIAQEAVTNSVRHAQAGQITLTLTYTPNQVELQVWDDGCGFDAGTADGIGLHGVRERAQRLAAHLTIESKPEQGTQVNIVLPVTALILP